MLPDGYYDCVICSTPTMHDICDGCDHEIESACINLDLTWSDHKVRKDGEVWIRVQHGPTQGRIHWRKHWSVVEQARSLQEATNDA